MRSVTQQPPEGDGQGRGAPWPAPSSDTTWWRDEPPAPGATDRDALSEPPVPAPPRPPEPPEPPEPPGSPEPQEPPDVATAGTDQADRRDEPAYATTGYAIEPVGAAPVESGAPAPVPVAPVGAGP